MRRVCRGRKCRTVLHGSVCHRTSTPHKYGNNMKRKKKLDTDTSTYDYDIKGKLR